MILSISLSGLLLAASTSSDKPQMYSCQSVKSHSYELVVDLPKAAEDAIGPPIAEKGAPFQSTDVIHNGALPNKRLVSARQNGCSLTVVYEQGGFAHFWTTLSFTGIKSGWKLISRQTHTK